MISQISREVRAAALERWDLVLDAVEERVDVIEDVVRSRVEAWRRRTRQKHLLAANGLVRAAVARTFAFEHAERSKLFAVWAGVETALDVERGATEPGRAEAVRLLRLLRRLEEFRATRSARPRPPFGLDIEAVAAEALDELAYAPVLGNDHAVRVTAEGLREALRPVLGGYAASIVTAAYRLDRP